MFCVTLCVTELDLVTESLNERSIFFHETSCFGTGTIYLTSRQLCAIESAAHMNPNMTIYLLVLSHSNVSEITRKSIMVLSSAYNNIEIYRIVIDDYIENTPLEKWWNSRILEFSQWPRSHASDVLRSLQNLTNFAGAEDWENVAAGAIGLTKTSMLGRKIADACIRDLKKNFRGNDWGNNGPGVITRALQKICATKYARDMSTARCHGFTVSPPSAFYPIHYKKWKQYFDKKKKNLTMEKVQKSFAIHVWNKLSSTEPVLVGSDVPYASIASKYCPKTYTSCGNTF
ncbi:lactosylceramide 4-alpha-galactosyltransferase-like isoform X2 [Aphidius gifuensis]|uniref:lactosylceramide 4-alpha-galactosyltransferase-like isoform X2 n=1 Tax=Aphidius gifuensis TaxID=684658 RepID=UPI001CDBF653|nr:lactosylceramide 4-alpha-galactosyltransferase-like isoform X2 [Aphidius gifuensis]